MKRTLDEYRCDRCGARGEGFHSDNTGPTGSPSNPPSQWGMLRINRMSNSEKHYCGECVTDFDTFIKREPATAVAS